MHHNNPLIKAFGDEPRWVVWKYQVVNGRKTKVPYTVSGRKASSTRPSMWLCYESVTHYVSSFDGVGLMFGKEETILGVDLDHVLENGTIVAEHKDRIDDFLQMADTYCEVSPSGNGLHAILKLSAPLTLEANRKGPYECYTKDRYFTVTFNSFGVEKPVRTVTPDQAEALLGILGYPWGSQKELKTEAFIDEAQTSLSTSGSNAALLAEMFESLNGTKLRALYSGDISEYENDESRADLALCAHLAFWTKGDRSQIEQIWLGSPLGSRKKTQSRKDYRTRTITKALESYADMLPAFSEQEEPLIDTSLLEPLTVNKLIDTLGLTIKHDEHNKVTAFLCQLSAYTEGAQFNISFSAPSSTGKSFIPMEVSKLFPAQDVIMLAYSSPTAFFHDSKYDPRTGLHLVDLERKILIFMDQPHFQLLEKLRPLLSHDQKEIRMKITDKNMKGGLKTKNIVVRGYPSVIFCTANIELDEQEATRLILLSPEISQEKIREGIHSVIRKEADSAAYSAWLEQDPDRKLLKERIRAIKAEKVEDVNIPAEMIARIESVFLGGMKMLKPRHQRDAKKLMSLVKAHALLNVWFRERIGSVILANEEDVEAAVRLWEIISTAQELNLPPYLYDFYKDIILALWKEKKESLEGEFPGRIELTRQEIMTKHREVTGRLLDPEELRLRMLPMLETSGLITQEMNPDKDKRQRFVYLVSPENILGAESQNNSAGEAGVDVSEGEFDADITEIFG